MALTRYGWPRRTAACSARVRPELVLVRALTGLQCVEQVCRAGRTRATVLFVGPRCRRHLVSEEMTGGKWCRLSGPREQVEPRSKAAASAYRRAGCILRVLLGAAQPLGSTTTLLLSYIRYTSTYNNVVGQI
jgi:hypothetical protein